MVIMLQPVIVRGRGMSGEITNYISRANASARSWTPHCLTKMSVHERAH